MLRHRAPYLLLFLVASLAGCGDSVVEPPPTAGILALENETFNRVNAHRTSQGLPALLYDSTIARLARGHSRRMASKEVAIGHSGNSDRVNTIAQSIPLVSSGENVAANNSGASTTVSIAVNGWIGSPSHRTNMEGDFDMTGIGVAENADGEFYFTQIFIKRR